MENVVLSGVTEDDRGLDRVEIALNNLPPLIKVVRDTETPEKNYPKRLEFNDRLSLQKGKNEIKIKATDVDGLTSAKILTVYHIGKRKNVWVVIIGINQYKQVRQLKYAVNDAKAFYDHLIKYNHLPEENGTRSLWESRRDATAPSNAVEDRSGARPMLVLHRIYVGRAATP